MKRLLGLMLLMVMVFSLTACGRGYEIAMISTADGIEDAAYNQVAWETLSTYANEHDITHRAYEPKENIKSDFLLSIELAVVRGAKIIFAPSFMLEEAFYEAQADYPEVKFVLIDGRLADATYDKPLNTNTMAIAFATHEAGFLAGYAVVKEGMRSLGFFGGSPVDPVKRFGIGYIAGAFYAAKELDTTIEFKPENYEYHGFYEEYTFNRVWAEAIFNRGADVIFSASGQADLNVMIAAQVRDAWMIATDLDQSHLNAHVLTSAIKALSEAVEMSLNLYYEGAFEGGKTLMLDVKQGGVSLPMDTANFDVFSQADYDAIYDKLVSGTLMVPSTYDALVDFFSDHNLDELPLSNAAVN